jgi:hypothetical protein
MAGEIVGFSGCRFLAQKSEQAAKRVGASEGLARYDSLDLTEHLWRPVVKASEIGVEPSLETLPSNTAAAQRFGRQSL